MADFCARILVPAGAALTLFAIAVGSARKVDHDLRLIAPDRVAPGQSLPVRCQLYAGLHRPQGAELITPPVELELRDQDGGLLVRTRMKPSYAHTLDAMLTPPAGYVGEARLAAVARIDGAAPRSERVLELGEPSVNDRLPLHERVLPPLQRFAPGEVHALGPEAPDALTLTIAGGACVPEQPCELLLHIGSPKASVRALASPALSPDDASARPSMPTSGVVRLRVTTHGPEAELRIVAEREGIEVASRAYRLAVALGASVATDMPRLLDAPALPHMGLRGDERGCIVDAFVEHRWLRTGALADCRGHEPLPFAALEPGLWRLQLRRDPFAAESAAVVDLYVRRPGEPANEVLTRIAQAVLEQAPTDVLARAVLDQPERYAPELELTARYLLSLLDEGILSLPEPVSGYPLAMMQLSLARAKLKKLALFVLLLCALTLGLIVAQRGLRAASEAGRVMAEAGEDKAQLGRQRVRMLLRVLATVSSLLLAFVAIAVYMIARSQGP